MSLALELRKFGAQVTKTFQNTPEAKAARKLEANLDKAATFVDRFDAVFKPKRPVDLGGAPGDQAKQDFDFVVGLYRDVLGREPDPDGLKAHLTALAQGATHDDVTQAFLHSPEFQARVANPEPANTPEPPVAPAPPAPPPHVEPGAALSTVPYLPEYASAPIDTSSPSAAVLSAARFVKDSNPALFARADDRQVDYQIMTKVIGVLRAKGFDATRVVNHTERPVGDGWRYGSDAVALNGRVYDCYVGIGDPNMNRPQASDVGDYASGRSRE